LAVCHEDAREADVGSQSADTIKLSFIQCGRLGIAGCGSAPAPVALAASGRTAKKPQAFTRCG
jgi:hypothetical protein